MSWNRRIWGGPIRSRPWLRAPTPMMNDLQKYAGIFDDITPWSGTIPPGFIVDFLGTLTSKKFLGIWGHQDRKSTRLNSSHTVISYAVFCLKKKTRGRPALARTGGGARELHDRRRGRRR